MNTNKISFYIRYKVRERDGLWIIHDDIHAILKSWTPADVQRKLRQTSAGELIPAVAALRALSSPLKRDRFFRPHTAAPQKQVCKLVGIKNRLKADLKERSRTVGWKTRNPEFRRNSGGIF